MKMLSVALLNQAKKSECGMAQPSSRIAGFNVLNKQYVRTNARNQGLSQLEALKIKKRMKQKKTKMNFNS